MGGKGNPWNVAAVYPLWVVMGVGAAAFTYRAVQWIGFDSDIQVTKKYRKSDPADSEFLHEQSVLYRQHPFRNFFQAMPKAWINIFPEVGVTPQDPDA
jgi:NADH-ubiquinone reductase complex 1 MLRQ subunit